MIAAGLFHVLPWICLAVVAFGVVVIGTTMQRAEKMADKLAARDSARRDAVLARDEAAFLLWADESSTDDDQHADVRVELAAAKRSFKWLRENMADPERRGMEEREYLDIGTRYRMVSGQIRKAKLHHRLKEIGGIGCAD